MKYLVAGRSGQLAQAFIRRFERESIDFLAPDESKLDITSEAAVDEAIRGYKPDVILNCAAYNLVDQAEREREKAFAVNALGPKHLARAAASQRAVLVHFGTDYVFDGAKEAGLYTEEDRVNPLSEYGKSKLAGEEAVRASCDEFLIFRLSWVYGAGKQNFIFKLTEWAKNQAYLRVACDEFSIPTDARLVVDRVLQSLDAGLWGRWHLTNSGFCSRYEWAVFIAKCLGLKNFIRPVSMNLFALPAKRPGFSPMSNAALSGLLHGGFPRWEEGVESFLRERW